MQSSLDYSQFEQFGPYPLYYEMDQRIKLGNYLFFPKSSTRLKNKMVFWSSAWLTKLLAIYTFLLCIPVEWLLLVNVASREFVLIENGDMRNSGVFDVSSKISFQFCWSYFNLPFFVCFNCATILSISAIMVICRMRKQDVVRFYLMIKKSKKQHMSQL